MALYWKTYIHSNQCHENGSGQRILPRASAECCCHIVSGTLITIGTSSSEQRRANRASKGRRCHGTQPFSTHAPTLEPASQNHSKPASAQGPRQQGPQHVARRHLTSRVMIFLNSRAILHIGICLKILTSGQQMHPRAAAARVMACGCRGLFGSGNSHLLKQPSM